MITKTEKGRRLNAGNGVLRVFFVILLVIVAFVSVYPFIYMFAISLVETYSPRLNWSLLFSDRFTFENYTNIIKNNFFLEAFKNTCIVTAWTVVATLFTSATAAYAFAKKKFTGNKTMYMLYLATMMVPGQVTLIPTFLLLNWMGLLNTYAGMILPCCGGAFGVLLIVSFMKNVPDELLEAADLDGCGELRKFFFIVLPMIKSVLVSLAIFTFISAWGSLVLPLLVAQTNDMMTLSVAVANMKGSEKNGQRTNYGSLMAGTTFAFIPPFILYLMMQKEFVEGIALSGTKG